MRQRFVRRRKCACRELNALHACASPAVSCTHIPGPSATKALFPPRAPALAVTGGALVPVACVRVNFNVEPVVAVGNDSLTVAWIPDHAASQTRSACLTERPSQRPPTLTPSRAQVTRRYQHELVWLDTWVCVCAKVCGRVWIWVHVCLTLCPGLCVSAAGMQLYDDPTAHQACAVIVDRVSVLDGTLRRRVRPAQARSRIVWRCS